MPADAFNNWLTETPRQPVMRDDQKGSQTKSAPGSVMRGGIDLGGLTLAAPEQ
jgi:hypothetical protein